jgi:phosphopantetheine--protein transferase-like protein
MEMNTSAVQVAGMAGEAHVDQVLAYLERLTGAPVAVQTSLKLRSVHRAAFTSWARKQNIPIQAAIMNAGNCTVSQVLGLGESSLLEVPPEAASPVVASIEVVASGPRGEVGIDMEEVESMPEASDYREHPFFQDHFAPAEIAYCIRRADVRISLCGLWAAKEAMLKAGVIPVGTHTMNGFEISHDESGRPTFPGCRLSISHTSKFAVAVCVAD